MSTGSFIKNVAGGSAKAIGQSVGKRAHTAVNATKALDKAIFKKVGFENRTFGREMRKGAFGLFVGGAAVVGMGEGIKEVDQEHMGTREPGTVRATPMTPTYAEDSGATGDLVFALHDLRRG